MLKLYDIKKEYVMQDYTVHALKGVSVNFRKSELVSILGPSGCGKTTLLNIIGGLDKYSSGDLIINDISTKEYKDRNWDIYRNQYVGFVFQSYNLIPHLNVLQNVELALTISGMSKSKRKSTAIEALEKVGLGEQLKKMPSQMSGGQCQRVAIARAIVTNPRIILADEPTGALDTKNSEQIMDLLQEISDDRLVVMVTHNPELAKKYSSRIIELLDGEIISDSNPYDGLPIMVDPVKPLEETAKASDAAKKAENEAENDNFASNMVCDGANDTAANGNNNLVYFKDENSAPEADADTDGNDIAENAVPEIKYVCGMEESEFLRLPATKQNQLKKQEARTLKAAAAKKAREAAEAERKEKMQAHFAALEAARNAAKQSIAKHNDDNKLENENNDDIKLSETKSDTHLIDEEVDKYVAEVTAPKPDKLNVRRPKKKEKKPRTSMSLFTALALSGRNLWTKKFRTGLVAFAGSIGIIGIALVLSLTNGFNIYIQEIQTSTLINMPVMISNMAFDVDTGSLIDMASGTGEKFPNDNKVHPFNLEQSSGVSIGANLISEDYIEYVKNVDSNLVNSVRLVYSFTPHLATKNSKGKIIDVGVESATSMTAAMAYWNELLDGDFMQEQYDVLAGRYPTAYDEIVLVVDQFNNIYTSVLEALGYETQLQDDGTYANIDFNSFIYNAENNNKTFAMLVNDNYYKKDTSGEKVLYKANSTEQAYNGAAKNINLKIVGVIRANENVLIPFINSGLAYTPELTEYYINNCKNSEIGLAQSDEDVNYNLITGTEFDSDYSALVNALASYGVNEKTLVGMVQQYSNELVEAVSGVASLSDAEKSALKNQIAAAQSVNDIMSAVSDATGMSAAEMKQMLAALIDVISKTQTGAINIGLSGDVVLELLNSGRKSALQSIGASTTPSSINIYPKTFADKNKVTEYLDAWNTTCKAEHRNAECVAYTDLAGTVSELITWIMDIVSGVLIAFAAISLVVSSIMIAIITYISVIERTTEIGVLRAIGARKIDVANVFNAETTIIGLISGVLGVILAAIIDLPINAYIASLASGAPPNFAQLNWWHALLLIALSVVLNILAGLIPAYMASKKDPVIALRSTN